MHGRSSDALDPKYPGGRARPYEHGFHIRNLTATFRKHGVAEDDLQIASSEWGTFASLLGGFCGASAHQPGNDPRIVSRRSRGRELSGYQLLFWQVLPLESPFLRLVVSEVCREAKFEAGGPAHLGCNPTPSSERAAQN